MGKCGISRSANEDFLSLCASVGRNIRLENSGMKGKKKKKTWDRSQVPLSEVVFHTRAVADSSRENTTSINK